jgi:hypothetical protein
MKDFPDSPTEQQSSIIIMYEHLHGAHTFSNDFWMWDRGDYHKPDHQRHAHHTPEQLWKRE